MGSTSARGYGTPHQRLRKVWARRIKDGGVTCWRCGAEILSGMPWDLGHDDNDRSKYHGPECQRCNRSAGGRKGARRRRLGGGTVTSRRW